MRVTFNTNNPCSYQLHNNRRQSCSNQQTFEGMWLPDKSQFLKPIKKIGKKGIDCIAKYYTKPLNESFIAIGLSRLPNVGQIVNHMQTLGSFIISGMYMQQTYKNKNMDEDRKKTLIVNQGLTLVASTIGAYTIDGALARFWDKHVAAKYASTFLQDSEFIEKWNKYNEKLEKEFKANLKNAKKKFKPVNVAKYVDDVVKNPALKYKLGGLDILKSLAVFGTVYRFLSPVAVTPIANWASDRYLLNKKVNKEAKNNFDQYASTAIIGKPEFKTFYKG